MSDIRFSVIIPAFEAQGFVKQCLDSVVGQARFKDAQDYEILLGVDGCPATLAKVKQIRAAYPKLRLFNFPKNHGPYVVRNTLAYQARGEYLIFFDADDTMLAGLPEWCEKNFNHEAVVQFAFYRSRGTKKEPKALIKRRVVKRFGVQRIISVKTGNARGGLGTLISKGAAGVFGIRRDAFLKLGGFKSWRCAADAEFQGRAKMTLGNPAVSKVPLFVYRKHPDCLTSRRETAGNSRMRANYHAMTKRAHAARPFAARVEPAFAPFEEIAP